MDCPSILNRETYSSTALLSLISVVNIEGGEKQVVIINIEGLTLP
jgi:hypothetical protein